MTQNFVAPVFFLSLHLSKLFLKTQGKAPTNSDNRFQNRDKQGQGGKTIIKILFSQLNNTNLMNYRNN